MPSVSAKQQRFMAAAAHDAGFARDAGISQSVAREFNRSDQRRNKIAHAIAAVRSQTCPECGATVPAGAQTCPTCGHNM